RRIGLLQAIPFAIIYKTVLIFRQEWFALLLQADFYDVLFRVFVKDIHARAEVYVITCKQKPSRGEVATLDRLIKQQYGLDDAAFSHAVQTGKHRQRCKW